MRVVALEPQELLALLHAAKAHSPRAHAMVLLAFKHGLRCSEVTGLGLARVNVRDGSVTIARLKGSLTTTGVQKSLKFLPPLEALNNAGWRESAPLALGIGLSAVPCKMPFPYVYI